MARPSTARAVDSMYTPRLLSDCEKEPQQCVDISQTHLHILAALKRRDAADVVFEAKVMALLDPVKKRLTEMTGESVSIQGAHVPELTLNPETAPDLSPAPQIFYGREQELSALVGMFSQETQAHTVLLGQDGAGKSALALTLLHHADIVRKFGVRRYLVRCDTSKGSSGIRSRLASVLGLSHIPEPAHRDVVLSTLASCPFDTLFVLDDLEHVWTPPSTRLALESLLADLAAIPSVSLLLTMRGTQRPLGPKYTRSNLPPLGPLPLPAARALFRAISDLPALVLDEDIAPVDFSVPPLIEVDTPPVVDTLVPGVSNAELAIVDTLLHRAERFPGPVVHFAQRAQYEPLSFLLAYSEDDDRALRGDASRRAGGGMGWDRLSETAAMRAPLPRGS
ncbi:hypothetical protein C8R43DRAFT_951291 [Mycena crocata]|nr:hypothetical protein C8R43DRAFT_951291 [Mycena crocata]